MNDVVFQRKKTNDESFRKLKQYSLIKTNNLKLFKRTWKSDRFYTDERMFHKILTTTIVFYWPNDLLEQSFKTRLSFYKITDFSIQNDFTDRSFTEKPNKINGKWTIFLRTNEIIF